MQPFDKKATINVQGSMQKGKNYAILQKKGTIYAQDFIQKGKT